MSKMKVNHNNYTNYSNDSNNDNGSECCHDNNNEILMMIINQASTGLSTILDIKQVKLKSERLSLTELDLVAYHTMLSPYFKLLYVAGLMVNFRIAGFYGR